MIYKINLLNKLSISLLILFFLNSCSGIWDPADADKVPVNAKDRVKKILKKDAA